MMDTLRRLWGLIRTEFLRQFDGPAALVFFLVLPLLFTAAVGVGIQGMMDPDDSPPEELRVDLYVLQDDEGPLVDALFDTLASVNFNPQPVDELPRESYGLEIPPDFSARLLAGEETRLTLHTRPDDLGSTAVEQAVRAAQGRVGGAALIAQLGVDQARERGIVTTVAEERTYFEELVLETLGATEEPVAVAEVNWPAGVVVQEMRRDMTTSVEQASAGQIVTWVQITLLSAAEILVDERIRGTLKRMLTCPTSRTTILGGKLIASLLMGLVQIAVLLLSGVLLFGVRWDRAPVATALVSFAFALALVGLGMLIATIVRTRDQASSVVVGASMTMAALGGAWFPLEVTPKFFRQAVQILPANWAMRAYSDILARGATLPDVLPHIGVLLGFAAIFITVGMVRFRNYT